jgi:sigma-B regulation protein RsbU (phosphoserine phosphatase)
MAELNTAICEQDLSSCQFCSALYCLVDSTTLEMVYARGGHPEPLLLRADGSHVELNAAGGLLGVFPEEHYQLGRVKLARGDRLVLYSDGAETAFRVNNSSGHQEFVDAVLRIRHIPVEQMSLQLAGLIDDRHRGDGPEDDITILILDVAAEGA